MDINLLTSLRTEQKSPASTGLSECLTLNGTIRNRPCRPCRPVAMTAAGGFFIRRFADHRFGGDQGPATEAASCKAVRTTLTGSMIPAFTMSVYSSPWAS